MRRTPSLWVGGAIWLGVQAVNSWLLGRSHDEGSGSDHAWYITALVLTVAWGVALGSTGAWRWAMGSVAVGAVWSTLWVSIAYYTDPDPQGESVLVIPITLIQAVELALLIGLGAGVGALYRWLRTRRTLRT